MRAWLLALAVIIAPIPASAAEVVSSGPEAVSVVVYPNGYNKNRYLSDWSPDLATGVALVTETRVVDLPAGPSTIRFSDVAEGIVPQTVSVDGLPEKAVAQDFDYRLLSPGSLMQRSIGRAVRLIRTNPATGEVTEQRPIVRSAPDGVMLDFGDRVEAFKCAGLNERIVLDDPPVDLSERPTLSITVTAPTARRYVLRLRYLATGLMWAADYVARVKADGRRADLTGWLTITNVTDTTFSAAAFQVLAGYVRRDRSTSPVDPEPVRLSPDCWRTNTGRRGTSREGQKAVSPRPSWEEDDARVAEVVSTGSFISQEDLGDYKLYSALERTTLAARQTKQLMFIDRQDVAFERVYKADIQVLWTDHGEYFEGVSAVARFRNDTQSGLGLPLPNGGVSLLEPDRRDRFTLAGEDRIGNVPVGQTFDVYLGRAQDIRLEARVIEQKEEGTIETSVVEVRAENNKSVPVSLELIEGWVYPTQILNPSRPPILIDGQPGWAFRLRPGQSIALRYTVRLDRR